MFIIINFKKNLEFQENLESHLASLQPCRAVTHPSTHLGFSLPTAPELAAWHSRSRKKSVERVFRKIDAGDFQEIFKIISRFFLKFKIFLELHMVSLRTWWTSSAPLCAPLVFSHGEPLIGRVT